MQIIENLLKKDGCLEIESCVYLWTQESIISDQKSWDEEDDAKQIDFSEHEYWITTNCGADPMGFDTINEALLKIMCIEDCLNF